MQISPVRQFTPNTFKGDISNNSQRIQDLERKQTEIQWATEGCNGGLNAKDTHELALRKELENLTQKHQALQWATEGCNGGLCGADAARMLEIQNELKAMAEEV